MCADHKNKADNQKARAESVQAHLLLDERGVALILTLSMLAILSVIGAYSLSSTNTDLRVTSNFRQGRQAFSAAERVINYVQAYVRTDASSDMELDEPIDLDTGTILQDLTILDGNGDLIDGEMDVDEDNTLTKVALGDAPKGMGIDNLVGEYYRVNVTGKASVSDTARARVEMVFFGVFNVGGEDDKEEFDDDYGADAEFQTDTSIPVSFL